MNTEKQLLALTADHWKNVTQENKMNFYECATHFFATNDLLKMVQSLENAKSENKQIQIDINKSAAGLKSLWVRYNMHVRDVDAIADKAKRFAESESQPSQSYTAAEMDALKCLVKTVDELDSGSENSKMHSVLGMIATLIEDDYLNKLDSILRENFQDYYFDKPAA